MAAGKLPLGDGRRNGQSPRSKKGKSEIEWNMHEAAKGVIQNMKA